MAPIINKKKCIGCKTCVTVCPMDCFGIQKETVKIPEVRFPDECWHCNACVIDCPVGAVSLRVPLPTMMVFMDVPDKVNPQDQRT